MRDAAVCALRNLAVRGGPSAASPSAPSFPLAAALSSRQQPAEPELDNETLEVQTAVSFLLYSLPLSALFPNALLTL